jgi:hypothetical protein
LISTESISQKKCDSSAQYRTSDNDEAEFWPGYLDFVHKSKIWGDERRIVSSMQSVNGERRSSRVRDHQHGCEPKTHKHCTTFVQLAYER